ncbi:MAG TPA: AAA family ATPase [Chitinophagaceae bacterium]|nr:AAA family ATPase [Chitinophagaceae bacterium]
MGNIILLIGPSGVGKSSALKALKLENVLTFKLDDLVAGYNGEPSVSKYFLRIGNETFFHKSIEAIEKLIESNPGENILVDVGAGSFDWEGSVETFLNYRVIALSGDTKILYDRIKKRALEKGTEEQRTLEEYASSEFKTHKRALYEKAAFQIDSTKLTIAEVATRITDILKSST